MIVCKLNGKRDLAMKNATKFAGGFGSAHYA